MRYRDDVRNGSKVSCTDAEGDAEPVKGLVKGMTVLWIKWCLRKMGLIREEKCKDHNSGGKKKLQRKGGYKIAWLSRHGHGMERNGHIWERWKGRSNKMLK